MKDAVVLIEKAYSIKKKMCMKSAATSRTAFSLLSYVSKFALAAVLVNKEKHNCENVRQLAAAFGKKKKKTVVKKTATLIKLLLAENVIIDDNVFAGDLYKQIGTLQGTLKKSQDSMKGLKNLLKFIKVLGLIPPRVRMAGRI
jgi:hypothetical protein